MIKNTVYKALPAKKLPKNDREQAVLLGLVELYLKIGKPIGSSTLQEHGFESLSTATIRNYFSKMEEMGYLKQQHTSGGRIPTEKAFRLYADTYKSQGHAEEGQEEILAEALKKGKPRGGHLDQPVCRPFERDDELRGVRIDPPLRPRLCPRYPAARTRLLETLGRRHHRFWPCPHRTHLPRPPGRQFPSCEALKNISFGG